MSAVEGSRSADDYSSRMRWEEWRWLSTCLEVISSGHLILSSWGSRSVCQGADRPCECWYRWRKALWIMCHRVATLVMELTVVRHQTWCLH